MQRKVCMKVLVDSTFCQTRFRYRDKNRKHCRKCLKSNRPNRSLK